jgi:hypothetical protein
MAAHKRKSPMRYADSCRSTMYLATLDCRDFKLELEQFAVDARRLAGYCRDVMNLSYGKPFRLVHTIFGSPLKWRLPLQSRRAPRVGARAIELPR